MTGGTMHHVEAEDVVGVLQEIFATDVVRFGSQIKKCMQKLLVYEID